MALILGLRPGEDFYVEDAQFVVVEIAPIAPGFTIRETATGTHLRIVATRAFEVAPDVFVRAGDRQQGALVRVAFDAPRSVRIVRGDRWRAERVKEPA